MRSRDELLSESFCMCDAAAAAAAGAVFWLCSGVRVTIARRLARDRLNERRKFLRRSITIYDRFVFFFFIYFFSFFFILFF